MYKHRIMHTTKQGERVTLATCEKREYAELIVKALRAYQQAPPTTETFDANHPLTEHFELTPVKLVST